MQLPNYFLADLPETVDLTPTLITEACQTLKRNRNHYLLQRSTESLIQILHDVSRSWLDPEYRFRKLALDQGTRVLGFSRSTLEAGLNAFFNELTGPNLESLVSQDLGHLRRLDDFTATPPEQNRQRQAIARGPHLIVHFTLGSIPPSTIFSIVLGILAKSAQIVKCASGTALFPRLFAHSLYEAEPKLGACLEITEWGGSSDALEASLFEEADCVTAMGNNEAVDALEKRLLPSTARFLGYPQKISFGFIAQEMLGGYRLQETAAKAALDVAAWNQMGSLSPHLFYIEEGGKTGAEAFGELLAQQLAKIEELDPRGDVGSQTTVQIKSRRAFYETRAAHSPETRHWSSGQSTAWTVVYEADPQFQLSCLNRFVYVKPVKDLATAMQASEPVRNQVSTIGIAAPEERARDIALALARWGAVRVCPLGRMQKPPLARRHDGRPSLGDLVTWTDWEQ